MCVLGSRLNKGSLWRSSLVPSRRSGSFAEARGTCILDESFPEEWLKRRRCFLKPDRRPIGASGGFCDCVRVSGESARVRKSDGRID